MTRVCVQVLAVVLLCAVTQAASQKQQVSTAPAASTSTTTAVQQTPGMLERIMQTYVYPMRDFDWSGAFRNLMETVRAYVTPEAKEPKSGYTFRDVVAALPPALDRWMDSPQYRRVNEEARFLLGPLAGYAPDLNDNVSPELAAHAYDYLGLLWLFTGMTILGALIPLYKYIPEEELLYPDYDFHEEPAKDLATASEAPGDMEGSMMGYGGDTVLKEEGEGMVYGGDMLTNQGDVTNYGGNVMSSQGVMMTNTGNMITEGDRETSSGTLFTNGHEEGTPQQHYTISYHNGYEHSGGNPSVQTLDSYNYNGPYQTETNYDETGGRTDKGSSGYPPPEHLWHYSLGHHRTAPSRH